MNGVWKLVRLGVLFGLAAGALLGCASTDSGGTVNGAAYYGTGFYDPWYYHDYYYPPGVVVTPPPAAPPRPMQPIYNPSPPRPMPMPSVPMTPRVR